MLIGFLELINNMLTSGMVPALYPDDEKESIIGQVGDKVFGEICNQNNCLKKICFNIFMDINLHLTCILMSVYTWEIKLL